MVVHAALDGPWDVLGEYIRNAGQEDASGSRRYYAGLLYDRQYSHVVESLGITASQVHALAMQFIIW